MAPQHPAKKSETPLPMNRIFAVTMEHRTMFVPKSEVEKAEGLLGKTSTATRSIRSSRTAGRTLLSCGCELQVSCRSSGYLSWRKNDTTNEGQKSPRNVRVYKPWRSLETRQTQIPTRTISINRPIGQWPVRRHHL